MVMIFLGITTTLFFIDVILVLIGCKKNIYSLTKYAKPFICPLILTECILVLTPLLPDSKNIMLMLSISLACSTAGSILADYITKRICILAGAAAFTAAGACFLVLLHPSFYLCPVPVWLSALTAAGLAAADIFTILHFFRKEDIILSVITAACFTVLYAFLGAAVVTAAGSFRLYSLLLLAGAVLLLPQSFWTAERFTRSDKKNKQFETTLLFALSELLVCAGFCCMILL